MGVVMAAFTVEKPSVAERFGFVLGGGVLLAALIGQALFVLWIAGW